MKAGPGLGEGAVLAGSEIGEELAHLIDAISFELGKCEILGASNQLHLAPAMFQRPTDVEDVARPVIDNRDSFQG